LCYKHVLNAFSAPDPAGEQLTAGREGTNGKEVMGADIGPYLHPDKKGKFGACRCRRRNGEKA